MEKMVVFGKQHLNFRTKEGDQIEGIKLHCTKQIPNEHWEGKAYEGLFISVKNSMIDAANALPVGSEINVEFNRFGKVDSFTVSK